MLHLSDENVQLCKKDSNDDEKMHASFTPPSLSPTLSPTLTLTPTLTPTLDTTLSLSLLLPLLSKLKRRKL